MRNYWGLLALCFSVTLMAQESNFDLQGHRGARGSYPENTWPAMLFALQTGVTTLEMDVAITSDNIVILSHEPFMNHDICKTLQGEPVTAENEQLFNIYKMTYEEVSVFDCGSKNPDGFPEQVSMAQIKPRLDDLLVKIYEYCKKNNRKLPYLNIEIKSKPEWDNEFHPEVPEYALLLHKTLESMEYPVEKIVIQSFDKRALQYLHQNLPVYKLAYLVSNEEDIADLEEALGFTPEIFSPYFELVTNALIKELHHQNIKVIPWTVNDVETAKVLKEAGVDGLITDYPEKIKRALAL